jgi:glycosyltransferase involved in cell wall biosynthesis
MKSATATIIVPCFRNEDSIANILADIKAQTCPNWELIVVGNGPSQEAQKEIVKSFAACDDRITYLSIDEAGVSRARNSGIEKASGEWIAFVDADDRVPPHWLSGYFLHVSKQPDMIVGGITYRDMRTSSVRREDLKIETDGLYCQNGTEFLPIFLSKMAVTYSPCTKLYNAHFLKSSGVRFREDISVYEDGIFNLELALVCKSMCFVRQAGYEYCLHPASSAIGRYHKCMAVAVDIRRKLIEDVMRRGENSSATIDKAVASQFESDMLDILLNEYRTGSFSRFKDKLKLVRELFADRRLVSAWKKSSPGLDNMPLVALRIFHAIRSPLLCVLAFDFLLKLRRAWR